ncbi:FGGY-family carbohydrate kinase [Larkinella bovis]|uniref:FGGY-family carbohydrate kinase n=1 Tax=Larkinella bovis TaxID=683041 RepID=A0ABW0I918_9BACT
MSHYLLGLDNGNTVCKAVLFDLTGREVHVASRKIATRYPHPGWSERDMDELWQATVQSIREVIQRAGVRSEQILAVGNTGHGNGAYLLDRSGKSLRGIQSLDCRAAGICAEWAASGLNEQVYPYTLQALWAAQMNTLLVWLKRHEPHVYAQIGTAMLCKDYINYCLTGRVATDYSDMSATNLVDVRQRRYSPELLTLYGLEEMGDALPEMHQSFEQIGGVTPAVARQTGLLPGTPVVAGLLDVDACLIGSGVVGEGQASLVAGSWSVNSVLTRVPLLNPDLAMSAIASVPDHWLCLEASATSVTNLEWFITQFCAEERLEAARRGVSVHTVCDEQVMAAFSHVQSPLIYHPFLHGTNVQATARAGFYGLAGWHTRADALRAVYEGVVFSHFSHVEKLRQGGVCAFNSVRLTGGGARSRVLCQLFADILGVRVDVPDCQETGALGAALSAGIGVGGWTDYAEAIQHTIRVSRSYEPDPERFQYYQRHYQLYQELIQSMEQPWQQMERHQATTT